MTPPLDIDEAAEAAAVPLSCMTHWTAREWRDLLCLICWMETAGMTMEDARALLRSSRFSTDVASCDTPGVAA